MTIDDPGDHEDDSALILRARDGDDVAYAELFNRHHPTALKYARSIAGPNEAEDLVAEAFTKLWSALGRDLGPVTTFRPYLLTTIRRLWANTLRSRSRVDVDEDIVTTADRHHAKVEGTDQAWSEEAIGEAFRQLPERWREVLWLTTVDGYSQAEVARHLDIKANAVAALSFRAREGLRREYLAQHLVSASDPQCQTTLRLLPGFVRESLDAKKSREVTTHLQTCATCGPAAANLSAINENLGVVLPTAALAGVIGGRHISGETSIPALPAPPRTSRSLLRRLGYPSAAAAILVLGFLLWPSGATPGTRTPAPTRDPSPQIQVIDLGRIPPTKPRPVHHRLATGRPATPIAAPPTPVQPAPTPPPSAGGGGTTVTGTTGGHTPATISASAS